MHREAPWACGTPRISELVIIFVLWLGGGGLIGPALSVPYHTQVVVQEPEVRLSDLVAGELQSPNPTLFTVTQPGQSLRVTVQNVIEAAAQQGVALTFDEPHNVWIHIQRACEYLTTADLEAFLNRQGQWGESFLGVLDQPNLRIPLPVGKSQTLALDRVEVMAQTQRFQAWIRYPDVQEPLRVSGRIAPCVWVPVLKEPMDTGQAIQDHHIDHQKKMKDQVASGYALKADELVGRVAAHPLKPGLPLRLQDVKRDIVIKKGQLVQVVCERSGLFVSVKARTLEEGGLGDTIKATNLDSKKEIYGVVRDSQTLEVGSSQHHAPKVAWKP